MILDVFVGGIDKEDERQISYAIEHRRSKRKGVDNRTLYHIKEDCSDSSENVYLLSVLHAFRKLDTLKKDNLEKVFIWMDLQGQKRLLKNKSFVKQVPNLTERNVWNEVYELRSRLAEKMDLVLFSGLPTNDIYCRNRLSELMEKEVVGLDLNRKESLDILDGSISTVMRLENPNKIIKERISHLTAYTDGSINGNDAERRTGYGIIIEANGRELFKIKGRIETQVRENIQFVELYSIYRAMAFINKKIKDGVLPKDVCVDIKADNLQSINVLNGEDVKERAIENLLLLDKIQQIKGKTDYHFSWVKGHADNLFNHMADSAAKKGSKLARAEEVVFQHTDILNEENTHTQRSRRRLR